jgi:sporulation protein YlmC with PRC-barrel domain
MLAKSITAGVLATALMSSVAFAQTPSSSSSTTTPSASSGSSSSTMASDSSSHKGEWRTSKLMGLDVYNDNNEKLGDINEVLVDKSGKITAVVIGVGGFLGIGENDVAVAFDKLKFVNEPVAYAAGSGASNTAGTRPVGNAATGGSNAPMTTTGTATPSGATTTTPTTTGAATGTGMAGSSSNTASSNTTTSRSNPWYPDHAVLSATKDQLKSMTQFKYSN